MNQVVVRDSGACSLKQIYGLFKIEARSNSFQEIEGGFMHPAALFIRQARKSKALLTSFIDPHIRHGILL